MDQEQDQSTVPSEPSEPQPSASVNGQSFQSATLLPTNQLDQAPVYRPSRWRFLFIVLGGLQALGIAAFFLIIAWAIQQADAGVSGTEFIGLILFVTLVPAVALIALFNLIGLPIFLAKHKPHGKWLVLSVFSLVTSVSLVLFGAFSLYEMRVAAPKEDKAATEQLSKESAQREQRFAADNAKPEITKEAAIELLQSCKLKGFYYTDQTDKSDPANGGWGELSTTGVVLTKVDGQPYRISIADRLIPELVPVARAAQKTCPDLQFWHDGSYEQWQGGHWYFEGRIVN